MPLSDEEFYASVESAHSEFARLRESFEALTGPPRGWYQAYLEASRDSCRALLGTLEKLDDGG